MKISVNTKTMLSLELTPEQFAKLLKVFDKISSDYAEYLLDNPTQWTEEDYALAGDIGFWLKMAQLQARL